LTTQLHELIERFADSLRAGETDIYNEYSLQHELGMFLRRRLEDQKVQFERNVGFFFGSNVAFTKREIDISVFSSDKERLLYAVELKYPRNGQYPEQMFSFCKDIVFCEELKSAGFSTTALVSFAEDPLFYKGPATGIYGFFRGGLSLHGKVQKPTGRKDEELYVRGHYDIRWKPVMGSLMCSVLEAEIGISAPIE
jgi:hypothetical protein